MRLGTVSCLLPRHTQLFSGPQPRPHLWGVEGAGGQQEQVR